MSGRRRLAAVLLVGAGLVSSACAGEPGGSGDLAEVEVLAPATAGTDVPSTASAPTTDTTDTTDTTSTQIPTGVPDGPITSAEEAGAHHLAYEEAFGEALRDLLGGGNGIDALVAFNELRDPALFADSAVSDAADSLACLGDDVSAALGGTLDGFDWQVELLRVDEVRPGLWVVTVSEQDRPEFPPVVVKGAVTSRGVFSDLEGLGGSDAGTPDECTEELSPEGRALRAELVAAYDLS